MKPCQYCGKINLTSGEKDLLQYVKLREGVDSTQVARSFGCTTSNASNQLFRLYKAAFLGRDVKDADSGGIIYSYFYLGVK